MTRSAKIMTVSFVAVLGLLALCVPAQAVPGMVSYWTFDEGSGNIVHDLANGNHGTIYGATWTSGIVGGALSFDGVNDYVNVGTLGDWGGNLANPWTAMLWFKTTTKPSIYTTMMGMWDGGTGKAIWHFGMWNYGTMFDRIFAQAGAYVFNVECWSPEFDTYRDGNWHYLAFSWDGDTHGTMYFDGEILANTTQSGVVGVNFERFVAIGAYNRIGIIQSHFNGTIDEVAIYNRALTGSEIWDSYVSVKAVHLLQNLAQQVIALNLQQGIANSLDAKLAAALQALDDVNENNDVAAINALQAFINAVEAQRGKKISQDDADALIAAAQQIIDMLTTE